MSGPDSDDFNERLAAQNADDWRKVEEQITTLKDGIKNLWEVISTTRECMGLQFGAGLREGAKCLAEQNRSYRQTIEAVRADNREIRKRLTEAVAIGRMWVPPGAQALDRLEELDKMPRYPADAPAAILEAVENYRLAFLARMKAFDAYVAGGVDRCSEEYQIYLAAVEAWQERDRQLGRFLTANEQGRPNDEVVSKVRTP